MTDPDTTDVRMIPMYGTVLTGETPSLIADLRSIEHDLRYAGRVFARLADVTSEEDADLRRALYDAGAIAYRRGFTTGRSLVTKNRSRTKVPDEIIGLLDDEGRRAHDAVLEHANTHIAHRVSDGEQGRVILILTNPSLGQEVQGVAYFFARFMGPDRDAALRAASTAELLAASINEFIESVQHDLIESATERDLDGLYATARPLGDHQPGLNDGAAGGVTQT